MMRHLIERVFRGDPSKLVSHLLGDEDISGSDLKKIESLLNQRGKGK